MREMTMGTPRKHAAVIILRANTRCWHWLAPPALWKRKTDDDTSCTRVAPAEGAQTMLVFDTVFSYWHFDMALRWGTGAKIWCRCQTTTKTEKRTYDEMPVAQPDNCTMCRLWSGSEHKFLVAATKSHAKWPSNDLYFKEANTKGSTMKLWDLHFYFRQIVFVCPRCAVRFTSSEFLNASQPKRKTEIRLKHCNIKF